MISPPSAPLPIPSRDNPIGLFDSGIGGLSITRALQARLPDEALLYVADHSHAPYGGQPESVIMARALEIVTWLVAQGAKAIVVACNTATIMAIRLLRDRLPHVPIIGVEPGIKPAVQQVYGGAMQKPVSRQPKIAVLATSNTVRGHSFRNLVVQHAGRHPVILQACPGFAELVESGDWTSPAAQQQISKVISPLIDAGITTLVLGCTHYIFLKPTIMQLAKSPITLIDTSHAVARQVENRLSVGQLLSAPHPADSDNRKADSKTDSKAGRTTHAGGKYDRKASNEKYKFFSTGTTGSAAHIVKKLWPEVNQISTISL